MKKIFSLVTAFMVAVSALTPVFAQDASPLYDPTYQKALSGITDMPVNDKMVTAIYTDEFGNEIEVEAYATIEKISSELRSGEELYQITAYASSPASGNENDGIVWAKASVFYVPYPNRAYRMTTANGTWTFAKGFEDIRPSSSYVVFYPGTGAHRISTSGTSFRVSNPSQSKVSTNRFLSSVSYRTSSSLPMQTLTLLIDVTNA